MFIYLHLKHLTNKTILLQPTSIYGDQLLENPKFRNEITGEFNQQILEQKLKRQQKESEEDSKWLAESETNLVSKVLFITNALNHN